MAATSETSLDRRIVLALAVACGASVANLYYAQPLLHLIAGHLHASIGSAGFLITASQLGYAAGLAVIVPLGDLIERRALVCRMLVLCAAGLVVVAVAPSLGVFAAAIAVVGITSTAAQVLVPLAATLAGDHERGRVVGTVMSGLLIGILLARTVSGVLAELGGWRLVFWLAAMTMLVLAAVLRRVLARSVPTAEMGYGALLKSIFTLVRTEPRLRRRMVYGAMGMAGFSALWTSLTFLLSAAPYHYAPGTIGLFGLVGVVGASAAQGAGRLADGGHLNRATGVFLVVLLAGWGFMAFAHVSLVALIVGIVLIDLGVQGQHISNQHTIYEIAPHARSRITTAYMTSNFLWGALGSAASAIAYSSGGWDAVAGMGVAFAGIGLLAWVGEQLGRRRAAGRLTLARERS